ncbi:Hypothetical predicted protein [Marmota monax]|uniref:Uncharacterized protein n=1 Tax=Marmota monax TaxID=9995 RepID=A0A5E4CMX1_MARMO|nr:Hypothetical predicted protein [Marmota monax]
MSQNPARTRERVFMDPICSLVWLTPKPHPRPPHMRILGAWPHWVPAAGHSQEPARGHQAPSQPPKLHDPRPTRQGPALGQGSTPGPPKEDGAPGRKAAQPNPGRPGPLHQPRTRAPTPPTTPNPGATGADRLRQRGSGEPTGTPPPTNSLGSHKTQIHKNHGPLVSAGPTTALVPWADSASSGRTSTVPAGLRIPSSDGAVLWEVCGSELRRETSRGHGHFLHVRSCCTWGLRAGGWEPGEAGLGLLPGESWSDPENRCVTYRCEKHQDRLEGVTVHKQKPQLRGHRLSARTRPDATHPATGIQWGQRACGPRPASLHLHSPTDS